MTNRHRSVLEEYAFDNDVPTALIRHTVCGWGERCDGDSLQAVLWTIEQHHAEAHTDLLTVAFKAHADEALALVGEE